MKQQEVFKKIGVIIQEINEQYGYLQGTAENLNDLELELFVANTHFLKDHAEILRKLNAIKSQPIVNSSIRDEPKWFEPVVQPAKSLAVPFKREPARQADHTSLKFDNVSAEEPTPAEQPAASIDLGSDTPADSYSFEREEPETIQHELALNEAEVIGGEDDSQNEDEALLTPVTGLSAPGGDVAEAKPGASAKQEPDKAEKVAVTRVEIKKEPEPGEEKATEPNPSQPVNGKGKKSVAESMEDIQVDNLKSTTVPENSVEKKPAKAEKPPETDDDDKILTLNQRLSAQRKDQAAKPAAAIEPLADIKTAINLNDKLLFVKDLFKGYNLAYTEAIEIVNRFTTFEEADRFLKNNYVTKNNWEGKKETSDKFYALLKRRYA